MGAIVAGMATSHAFALLDPVEWDDFRAKNRESFRSRTGMNPPPHPGIERESLADNQSRYARVRAAHQALRRQLADERPDAIVLIGDDQNENFISAIPQLALFTGNSLRLGGRFAQKPRAYPVHQDLTHAIFRRGIQEGFDITAIAGFDNDELKSHAHVQVLEALSEGHDIPVVPVFINAIHHPAIEPHRCYAFGQMIARAIAERPAGEKVALCASGGLSHFTAGYPWKDYEGRFTYGGISEDFDRRAIALIERGEGEALASLTGAELLRHGDIEMRSWIALLGALGAVAPDLMVYEPFYRGITGMAVASWRGVPLIKNTQEVRQ